MGRRRREKKNPNASLSAHVCCVPLAANYHDISEAVELASVSTFRRYARLHLPGVPRTNLLKILKLELHLNNIYKFSSYLIANTLLLSYKDQ
jgi:hypothetical protein